MYFESTRQPSGHVLHALSDALTSRIRSRRRRRKLTTLLDLDDHMLTDIGVTRAEVETALNLPLSVNAAVELRRMSLSRRLASR